jgi:hypothetical protein
VDVAKKIPGPGREVNVILCLSEEDDPPFKPEWVGNTLIARLGHKGKYVGVVGVYKTDKATKPFDLHYQVVEMSPDWKTPKGKEADQPIIALMEHYTAQLKAEKYLEKYGKIAHQHQVAIAGMPKYAKQTVKYVGSKRCGDCHTAAYAVWKKTDHAHAYDTLVNKAKHPSLREFDPECIVCHTVGYRYQSGFVDAAAKIKLTDVGCESCHGPGSLHAANPGSRALRALMNPWKVPAGETPAAKTARQGRIQNMCLSCHDEENDVTWKGLPAKWAKIDHPTPADEHQAPDED